MKIGLDRSRIQTNIWHEAMFRYTKKVKRNDLQENNKLLFNLFVGLESISQEVFVTPEPSTV